MTVVRRQHGQLPTKAPSPTLGSVQVVGDGVSVVVFGRPAPQGSKTPIGLEANHRTRPWREMIKTVCEGQLPPDWQKLDGPLQVDMVFYFDPPASAIPGSLPYTKTTYDWDKLARALGDGLTAGGVIVDDARITDAVVRKRYIWDGGEPRAIAFISPCRT